MRRIVTYILSEEQATCVGDVRTAKSDLEMMAHKILKEQEIPATYADFCFSVANTLGFALDKLEIE